MNIPEKSPRGNPDVLCRRKAGGPQRSYLDPSEAPQRGVLGHTPQAGMPRGNHLVRMKAGKSLRRKGYRVTWKPHYMVPLLPTYIPHEHL